MKCDHKVIRATNLKAHICMKSVALIGGRLACQLKGNILFGKVYYSQVVVQHVFRCETLKHGKGTVLWVTDRKQRAQWCLVGADSGHKMLHIGPRLNRNSYLRSPPHHLHIIISSPVRSAAIMNEDVG